MNNVERFDRSFATCPLVAILRGLTPDEAPEIGDALADAGFTLVEVPLNSPQALESIAIMADRLAGNIMVGAGTVLTKAEVAQVASAGGQFIVSPNTDVSVIGASVSRGLASLPGYYTPSEALAALAAGANALKLFPADGATPKMLTSQRAILPTGTRVLAVGGISEGNMAEWYSAGANGFGLGSRLYCPGKSVHQVSLAARAMVTMIGELAQ